MIDKKINANLFRLSVVHEFLFETPCTCPEKFGLKPERFIFRNFILR
jgi:hypothetical protein